MPAHAQVITCQHCHSHSAAKHNESAAWTERVEQIDRRTQQLTEQMAKLQYENEVARLDREWNARPDVQRRLRSGQSATPSSEFAFGLMGATGLALSIAAIANAQSGGVVLLVPGAMLIVGALVNGLIHLGFTNAYADYEQHKKSLHWRQFLPVYHPQYIAGWVHDSASDAQAVGAAMGASMTMMAALLSEAAMHEAQQHAAQQHQAQHDHHSPEPTAASEAAFSGSVEIPTPDYGAASGSVEIPAAMPDMSVSVPDFSSAMPSMDVSMSATPDISGSMSFGSDASGGM